MTLREKTVLVCYLSVWTTFTAWAAVSVLLALYPDLMSGPPMPRTILRALPACTPLVALPIALRFALALPRRGLGPGDLLRYFLAVPLLIYLALLALASLATFVLAPITFVLGFVMGLPALFAGIVVHVCGLLPLWFLRDRWPETVARTQASDVS